MRAQTESGGNLNKSTNEIKEFLVADYTKRGYLHAIRDLDVSPFLSNWERELIERKFESRTDVWKDYNRNCMNLLKSEMAIEEIPLTSHFQGTLASGRVKPDLWSTKATSRPSKVEQAAAEYYSENGFYVANVDDFISKTIAVSVYLSKYGQEKGENLIAGIFPTNGQIHELDNIQDLSLVSIEEWLRPTIIGAIDYFSRHAASHFNKDTMARMRKMKEEEKRSFLTPLFCQRAIFNAKNVDDLVAACLHAANHVPVRTMLDIYIRENVFSIRSGIPDLFSWNEKSFRFIEVKSPRDRPQLNQAYFYRYILRPLGLPFTIGKVVEN